MMLGEFLLSGPYGLVGLKERALVISHYLLSLSQLVPLGKCKFMGPL